MLNIPNLHDTPFHRIEAGLTLPADRLTQEDWMNLPDDFGDAPVGLRAELPGERPLFVSVKLEPSPDFPDLNLFLPEREIPGELHAEVSLSISNPFNLSELWDYQSYYVEGASFNWRQSDPGSIWSEFRIFLGKTVGLRVDASFSIDRDAIPPESLVASMIGLRTKAGEEQFLLNGAQFSVRGFPDDTISWYLKPGSNCQTISGNVIRNCLEEFHPESISDVVHVLEARFNRMVRAQSNIRTHATS